MLIKIRNMLKEKGQGIVEYALLLAFVVGIAMMLNGANLGGAVKDTFDKVAAVLGGEKKYADLLKEWGKLNRSDLMNIDNEKRIKTDQEALANIAGFFVGKTRDFKDDIIGSAVDGEGWTLLVDYIDKTGDSDNLNVSKGTDRTNGRIFNWMQGDYGEYQEKNGKYVEVKDSYDSTFKNNEQRYLFSNSMIEDRNDKDANGNTINYLDNRGVRIHFEYEGADGGAPKNDSTDVISSARVIVSRGDRKVNNDKGGAYIRELDVTKNKGLDATPTHGNERGFSTTYN